MKKGIISSNNKNNAFVTARNRIREGSRRDMCSIKINPECVNAFFENLRLKGETISDYARIKRVNRSKLSQIIHSLNIPKTISKRKFWAEEVFGFSDQIFWIIEEAEVVQDD